jgi:hypothetical protein
MADATLSTTLRDYLHYRDSVRVGGRELSGHLHELIGREPDSIKRGSLLRVRRALFNSRTPDVEDLDCVFRVVATDVSLRITDILTALRRRDDALNDLRQMLPSAHTHARETLHQLCLTSPVANGIALSSSALSDRVHQTTDFSSAATARQLQIERGLLRYVTRTAMKSTPFSTFCEIAGARFVTHSTTNTTSAPVETKPSPAAHLSIVRLNKLIFAAFWDVLRTLTELRRSLLLELNPTLTITDQGYRFIAQVDGVETFQTVQRVDVIEAVVNRLYQTPLKYDALAAFLVNLSGEDDAEKVTAFAESLLAMGLLRFRSPVPSQDADWDCTMCAWLADFRHPHAVATRTWLEAARAAINGYAEASTPERKRRIESLRRSLTVVFESMGRPPIPSSTLILFEDTGSPYELSFEQNDALNAVHRSLAHFVALRAPIAAPRRDMATMRHFFDATYGNAVQVPLLKFSEAYYRGHLRDYVDREMRVVREGIAPTADPYDLGNPRGVAFVDELRRHETACREVIAAVWAADASAEEVNILPSQWPPLPPAAISSTDCQSIAVFLQFVLAGDGACQRAYVGAGRTFHGFGKYLSRFLPLVADDFTEGIRRQNAVHNDPMLVELVQDANFNANFHPDIVPRTLEYPTGDNDQPANGIKCSDLVVDRDPEDANSLRLIDTISGHRVVPIDTGFLNPRRRPALFRLLSCFTPPGASSLPLPQSLDERNEGAGLPSAPVVYRPRIVFDGSVVVARRRWSVRDTAFPRRAGEDLAAYLVRVNEWREDLGIPSRVYVRIDNRKTNPVNALVDDGAVDVIDPERELASIPLEGGVRLGGQARRNDDRSPERRSRDYAKPQYIDFENPMLADLFGRLPAGIDHFVAHLEEQYPTPEQSIRVNGVSLAAELIQEFALTAK